MNPDLNVGGTSDIALRAALDNADRTLLDHIKSAIEPGNALLGIMTRLHTASSQPDDHIPDPPAVFPSSGPEIIRQRIHSRALLALFQQHDDRKFRISQALNTPGNPALVDFEATLCEFEAHTRTMELVQNRERHTDKRDLAAVKDLLRALERVGIQLDLLLQSATPPDDTDADSPMIRRIEQVITCAMDIDRFLARLPVKAAGADLSDLVLNDLDVLEGTVWTYKSAEANDTMWPPGLTDQVLRISREISPGLYKVTGHHERQFHPAQT